MTKATLIIILVSFHPFLVLTVPQTLACQVLVADSARVALLAGAQVCFLPILNTD